MSQARVFHRFLSIYNCSCGMSRLRNKSSILFNKILSVVHKSMLKILWCCVFCGHIIEKLLELMESRTMPPPSLQIYLRSRVSLTFDQPTPKLIIWCHFHVDHLCHWHQDRFIRFGNRRMNGRTDERTDTLRTLGLRLLDRDGRGIKSSVQCQLLFMNVFYAQIN